MKKLVYVVLLAASFAGIAEGKESQRVTFETAIKKPSFAVPASTKNQSKLHDASTLLVSCVDFRLRDETWKLMEQRLGLKNDYDETAIPGAALALVQDQKPEWGKTLENIIDVVHTLHHIKRVIFLDHYECGAYKLMRGADHLASKDTDVAEHKAVFQQVRARMKERFPELDVYTMSMDLDGNVQNIS